jgi:hypothetical protein
MNQIPPRPPPLSPSRGDVPAVVVPRAASVPDASSLAPETTYASLSPLAGPRLVSFRVPARTASGRTLRAAPPLELVGPPGTSFTLPGLPPPVWQWATVHGLQITIAVALAVLFGMGKASEHLLITVYGILVAAQLNPVRVPETQPQTYTTTPPVSASTSPPSGGPVPITQPLDTLAPPARKATP